MSSAEATAIIVMGVAGAGKTAVGHALANALQWRFVEGDDYHPRANVDKMSRGVPLSDDDRRPWLEALRGVIATTLRNGEHVIIACSALKHGYREVLRAAASTPGAIRFVYLDVPRTILAERLAERQHHFAPPDLLESQLETLETPRDALWMDGTLPVTAIVDRVVAALHLSPVSSR